MPVVLEHFLADRRQPDLALASVVRRCVFVNRSEVAVGVPAAVVVSGEEDLAAEVYCAAPVAGEVLGGGGLRQAVGLGVVLHGGLLPSFLLCAYYRHSPQ